MTDDLNNRTGNSINIGDVIKSQLDVYFDNVKCGVKVVDALSALDFSFITNRISHKHSTYSKNSLLKLYLYRKVHRIRNYYALNNHIGADLSKIGFVKFPSKKCFNNFLLKVERSLLDFIAESILTYCVNKNVSDIKLLNVVVRKRKEIAQYDAKMEEAIKMVRKFVYPNVKIKIRHNASITTSDLLDILTFMASRNDFCNNGTKCYMRHHQDKKVPKGDTVLYHLSKLDEDTILSMFDKIFDVIFNFAKKQYKIFKHRHTDIAFDVHEIPFYGDINLGYVSGGKFQNGTSYFYKFLTCSIVVAGCRFTIDCQPIISMNQVPKLLDRMLQRIKTKIRIGIVYMDRGFDNIDTYLVLKKHKVKFLMPKSKSSTVKQWYDKAEGAEARVIKNFKIGNNKKFTMITLVLVDVFLEGDDEGDKHAFATNIPISEPIAHKLCMLYKKRWGIETSYRNMDKDFKPRTTTTNYNIRLLYFLFTVTLYNFWVLVNICIGIELYGKIQDTPPMPAKLFMEFLLTLKKDVG